MPELDSFILMGVGGFFIILGVVLLLLGRREEKTYYNSRLTEVDVREFLEHSPERPELGALRIGGRISVAVGVVLLAVGGAFLAMV